MKTENIFIQNQEILESGEDRRRREVGGTAGKCAGFTLLELFVNDKGNAQGLRFQFKNTRIISVDDDTTASGGGTGKARMDDFHVVWNLGKTFPILMQYCATGKH